MPRGIRTNAYHHVSVLDFCHRGRSVFYKDFGLSYLSIAAHVGLDSMTVCRIRKRWVQQVSYERRAWSQRPVVTNSREDRHLICMALMDHDARSRNGFVYKTTSVYMNSLTTFTAVWPFGKRSIGHTWRSITEISALIYQDLLF